MCIQPQQKDLNIDFTVILESSSENFISLEGGGEPILMKNYLLNFFFKSCL